MDNSEQDRKKQIRINDYDRVTMKEVILKVIEWKRSLLSAKNTIIVISLFFSFAFAFSAKFLRKPVYKASYALFFEENNFGANSAMRLASSFGLSMASGVENSSTQVNEFLTCRNNIEKALTKELENGRLIDRFLEKDFHSDKDFLSEFKMNFGKNQRYTDSIISVVSIELNEDFLISRIDQETGIVYFDLTGKDEAFVYDLSNLLVRNAEKIFVESKKTRSQLAVKSFQKKVDSLNIAIDNILREIGEYDDQNNSLVRSLDRMKRVRLSIEMEALKISYGEYIKGLEMTKAELMNIEPPFKFFDSPTYPLSADYPSALKSGILGFCLTGFVLIIYVITRHELKKIMLN